MWSPEYNPYFVFQCEIVKQSKRKKGKINNNDENKTYIKCHQQRWIQGSRPI